MSHIPVERQQGIKGLIDELVRVHAVDRTDEQKSPVEPSAATPGISLDFAKGTDPDFYALVATTANSIMASPGRVAKNVRIFLTSTVNANNENLVDGDRLSHSLLRVGGATWYLPPGIGARDILKRSRPPQRLDPASLPPRAGVLSLLQLAAQSNYVAGTAVRFDDVSLETSRHPVIQAPPQEDKAHFEVNQDATFSERAATICDDLTGPIGKPVEGVLQQLPLQVSSVAVSTPGSTLTAYGAGNTLEAARADAAQRGLLWHTLMSLVHCEEITCFPLHSADVEPPGQKIAGHRLLPVIGLKSQPSTVSSDPVGFAQGPDRKTALAAALLSFTLAEHTIGHSKCHGRRFVPAETGDIELLRLFSEYLPSFFELTCAPCPAVAITVSPEESVVASGLTVAEALSGAVQNALLFYQSQLAGNRGIEVATHPTPTPSSAPLQSRPIATVESLAARTNPGLHEVDLTHDRHLSTLFPHQIGIVAL